MVSFAPFGHRARGEGVKFSIPPTVQEMDTFTPIVHRSQEADTDGFVTASFS